MQQRPTKFMSACLYINPHPNPQPTKPYLCEPEDVVHKQQHVLALHITEVLSNSQTCGEGGTGSGGGAHTAQSVTTLVTLKVITLVTQLVTHTITRAPGGPFTACCF